MLRQETLCSELLIKKIVIQASHVKAIRFARSRPASDKKSR
ncbi:hypothetical protein BRCON_0411 [Candidatus Sumerlaea chitinivorans]|uniref:Uncharacterized protein n=1 Tax=Sumerlaea chitinivorans TaxID=2250252 RepID=A0A2Z4Y2W9_SUMC1|nr:hypothetical protein BRCON_0411 [Candidatus Sumerlaea chitinivorans]